MRLTKEPKKTAEPGKETQERKPRFQIVKLEERIAPGCHHQHGSYYDKLVGCGKQGKYY